MTLASRNREKTEEAANAIRSEVPNAKLDILEVDVSSLASVRTAADIWIAKKRPLHILYVSRDTPPVLTAG